MESKNLIYLVTEYAANGELLGELVTFGLKTTTTFFYHFLIWSSFSFFSLLDLLIREKRLSEAKAREKFRQLVLAVEYIHSKNIVNKSNSFASHFLQMSLFFFVLGTSYVAKLMFG